MLKIYEAYAPRANPPDANYPLGSVKNVTVPGAKDGTPLDNKWGNNTEGFYQALLADAGIVANGQVEKVGASQLLDAVKATKGSVDNVDALRLKTGGQQGDTVFVTSYYAGWASTASGAQGGGLYVLNKSSTRIDNIGAIAAAGGGMWEAVFQSGVIDASRFGMKGDLLTVPAFDSGPALNNAILFAAQGSGNETGMTISVPSMNYKITTKVLIPSWVTIDFNGSTLTGSGFGSSDTVMFETAYYNSGVIISNIGTPAESKRVIGCKIRNGRIENAKYAFNLYNFNEGSIVEEFSFSDVASAIYASRSFYGEFKTLMCRGSAGGTASPAYTFNDFVNVENIVGVFVQGRINGWLFNGGINGLSLSNNGAEGLTGYGMKFIGEVKPINIDSNYFEGITGPALDFSDSSQKNSVTIDNNWFFLVEKEFMAFKCLAVKLEMEMNLIAAD
ncbi:gp63 tail-fiber protein [Iodobacter phage PhiPLPE]|uniref:Gp63 tail-fiber protein n=1 Tax=Iodobacter phage PhiPLPE TaxID=551895 RepID=B5AX82_9CAUD|nr:tail fiber protein [Iodobacter phage PhiPLPE]ACG60385.1 gp63 tail-fiber protein [Iodobacter phage PhiPLPE]